MSHFRGDMTIEEYLDKLRRKENKRVNERGALVVSSHGRGGHGHNNIVGFSRESYRTGRLWGVYLVDGQYYISAWTDLPHYNVGSLEEFYASDKREALMKGDKIVEAHIAEQMKLPEDKRIKTIPRKEYTGYYGRGGEDGGYGV